MILSQNVKSSAIQKISYNTDSKILSVTFQQGATYDYPSVPELEFHNLINAESVGKYFNKYIKPYSINFTKK